MDEYAFNHALREYMKRRDKELNRLMSYAKMMHLENKLRKVMEVCSDDQNMIYNESANTGLPWLNNRNELKMDGRCRSDHCS